MAASRDLASQWTSRMRAALGLPAARTIRLKLTLLYGAVFLVTGAVLLTIGYLLVRHNLGAHPDFRAEARRLGVRPPQPSSGELSRLGRNRFPPLGESDRRLLVAAFHQAQSEALHRLLLEYIVALAAMTGISVAAGWLLAGRALAPLREIIATAQRVSAENLGERIALAGPADELKELADTFDGMLARLDRTFASQRHFVASASHELRTPLAIMRTEIDVALSDPHASRAELRTMGEAVRETIDRSEALIAALLMLARSRAVTGKEEQVDLAMLTGDCITDLHRAADEAGIEIHASLDPAAVRGEQALLARLIANLLDNGIRHNAAGGELEVSTSTVATAGGDRVSLVVRNGGEVIDAEVAPTLTDPFRRLNRAVGGFGLGLSIVRSVAEAHDGSVAVTAPPAGGLEVRVDLPADLTVAITGRDGHRTFTRG